MQTARLLPLSCLLLSLATAPALAQTSGIHDHFTDELAALARVTSGVEALRAEAIEAGQDRRLRCIDDRAMYVRGLDLAVRTGLDEYGAARSSGDTTGMRRAAERIGRSVEQAPLYLAEAEACTELVGAKLRDECSRRPGEACTRWTVRAAFDEEYDEWGAFGLWGTPTTFALAR